MSEDIIESIDGALRDWETSDDAMRWVPPEDRKPKDARYVPTLREAVMAVWLVLVGIGVAAIIRGEFGAAALVWACATVLALVFGRPLAYDMKHRGESSL